MAVIVTSPLATSPPFYLPGKSAELIGPKLACSLSPIAELVKGPWLDRIDMDAGVVGIEGDTDETRVAQNSEMTGQSSGRDLELSSELTGAQRSSAKGLDCPAPGFIRQGRQRCFDGHTAPAKYQRWPSGSIARYVL